MKYDSMVPDTWPDGLCSCGDNYIDIGESYATHLIRKHVVKIK